MKTSSSRAFFSFQNTLTFKLLVLPNKSWKQGVWIYHPHSTEGQIRDSVGISHFRSHMLERREGNIRTHSLLIFPLIIFEHPLPPAPTPRHFSTWAVLFLSYLGIKLKNWSPKCGVRPKILHFHLASWRCYCCWRKGITRKDNHSCVSQKKLFWMVMAVGDPSYFFKMPSSSPSTFT